MGVSGVFMTVFVAAALVSPGAVGSAVDTAFTWSARWFGAYWQLLMLATFVIITILAFSRYGRVRMGGSGKPEFNRFTWVAMITTTLLAAGGVFWAAAEPIAHYSSPPPQYADRVDGGAEGAAYAMAQSFVHWGFIGWAVGGALATLVMMRGVEKGMPLRPRTLLWPVMGERVRTHWIGTVVDISCVLAVVAGTVGPIGFLGLQISYICSKLFGLPDTYAVQVLIILGLTVVSAVSVLSGIHKGIQLLSRANVWVALALILAVLGMGSLPFVADLYIQANVVHAQEFLPMALYTGDEQWLGYWTLFFFGWFLGFGPMMAIFFARISRGRTVRDIYVGATVLPTVVTTVWFTALGGTGIWLEQQEPGVITGPYAEDGLPAAALAILDALPLTAVLGVLTVLVALIFLASTLDSMSYAISVSSMHEGEPSGLVRAFWCVGMGLAAVALLLVGDGGIQALQSFIVVTAVPVGLIMLPTLWTTHPLLREMAIEQGIVVPARAPSSDEDGVDAESGVDAEGAGDDGAGTRAPRTEARVG